MPELLWDEIADIVEQGSVGRAVQKVQNISGVGFVELPRCAGGREPMMLYCQRARLMASGRSVIVAQLDVQAEAACALGEHVPIGQTDELAGQLAARNRQAQFRSDTGGLPRGQRDARMAHGVFRGGRALRV